MRCNALIATLVHFLVEIFEAPPTIKVVPEVVERLDIFLRIIIGAEHRHRLSLAEPRFALKHGCERLEEVRVGVLSGFELRGGRHVVYGRFELGVDRVELPSSLRVREDLHGLLDALEEGIVVGIARHPSLFVWVMFQDFLAIFSGRYLRLSTYVYIVDNMDMN